MKLFDGKWIGRSLVVAALLLGLGQEELLAETLEEASMAVETGFRRDQVDWNIAGNVFGTNPNVLSELVWKDLDIFQVGVKGRVELGNRYHAQRLRGVFKGAMVYGTIIDGSNRDSDYDGDYRTLEYSRSENSGDGGEVFDLSAGAGVKIISARGTFSVAPLLGYALNLQNLRITDGFQTVDTTSTPDFGPIDGLNSRYEMIWYGPWLGVEADFSPHAQFKLITGFEYHLAQYKADANWNLRNDLAHPLSFRHEADAQGIVVNLGARWDFDARWSMNLGWVYQKWETDPGRDTIYFSNGTTKQTRLNEVTWESQVLNLGLLYRFR